jgi:hypothetical protein
LPETRAFPAGVAAQGLLKCDLGFASLLIVDAASRSRDFGNRLWNSTSSQVHYLIGERPGAGASGAVPEEFCLLLSPESEVVFLPLLT